MTKSMLLLHIRWQIIENGLTTRQIAKHLGISRPRISNFNDLKYLEVLLKERVDWYLYELQSEMELWM
ncbi:hypothetical protein RhiirA5_427733 [Rhizophagus irregularis]|uniref:HigA2-like helix-turn-helix domain-containing protein n=1 Tax=Rhizophagus irregularis TaxID=588596 RepID=A0A2N0P1R1_9GLOM|nr:hypothetical protein RhiirA5_427733 [Rhizophagus irregularis]PKC64443.1 hypothetical protein RhiirA1_462416 [Rhizophagus irregularis]